MLRNRKARRILGVVGAFVLLQGILIAASLPLSAIQGGGASGLERVDARAPDFRWESPDGTTGSLAALEGRPVLVHLWASWCPTCRAELPSLLDYADGAPVQVVAVSLDDRWPAVLPLVRDTDATVVRASSEDAARAFGTRSVPDTWLVDADGRMRAHLAGAGDWTTDTLRSAVTRALDASTDAAGEGTAASPSRAAPPEPAADPAHGCEFPEPPATEC